jgi:hypothetical protein
MSTLSTPASTRAASAPAERSAWAGVGGLVVSLATAVVILALALLPLLTPAWIHSAMAAAGGGAAEATLQESFALSNQTVGELVFGPGSFAISYADGRPLYGPDEVSHMQDVRLVLWAFLGLAALAAVVIGVALARASSRPVAWRAVARGGLGLAIGLVAVGAFAALAFSVAFELFHRLLFPGGNWAFDPAQANLVRLYPLGFWQLSAAAYGVLGAVGGLSVWLLARRRARRGEGTR